MQRRSRDARPEWRKTVEEQGLTYAVDRSENGGEQPYWNEQAEFEFSEAEVDRLETVTAELHEMTVQACRHMVGDASVMDRLALPRAATEIIRASLDNAEQHSIYGRFDLAWDGSGDPKLLEYNADCPAALVETAVTQWYWLEDTHPDHDQWNLVHERLVQAWQQLARSLPEPIVHFAVGENEPNEDWATVAYLRDTARETDITDFGVTMEELGWDGSQFVDANDRPVTTCFKMYPWEWMLFEDFGNYVMAEESSTVWIEPPWKALAGSKALLPVLWEMFPDHPNLLPAFFDEPRGLDAYVSKPVFGWEGAGIEVVRGSDRLANPARHTDGQARVFQQYVELPRFDGNNVVLGTWVINGHPSGLGIRESDSLITDTNARFVPHYIDTPRSTPEEIDTWLRETEQLHETEQRSI